MSAEDVIELFSEVGEVLDVYLPRQQGAENHKGYGFVEMSSAREAQDAIDEIHGTEDFYGRELTVRIADRDRPRM
jgi:RNA recognition motif-containing protein